MLLGHFYETESVDRAAAIVVQSLTNVPLLVECGNSQLLYPAATVAGQLRLEFALLAPSKCEDAEIVDRRADVAVAHD
jgi:hypothetical protein